MSSGVDLLASPRSETVILARGGSSYNAVLVGLAALSVIAGLTCMGTLVFTNHHHNKRLVEDSSTTAAIKMVEFAEAQREEENKNIQKGNEKTDQILKDIKQLNRIKSYANDAQETLKTRMQTGKELAQKHKDALATPTFPGTSEFERPDLQKIFIQFFSVVDDDRDGSDVTIKNFSQSAVQLYGQITETMATLPRPMSKEFADAIGSCVAAKDAASVALSYKNIMSMSADQQSALEGVAEIQIPNTQLHATYSKMSDDAHSKLEKELIAAMKIAMDYPIRDARRFVATQYVHHVGRLLIECETLRRTVSQTVALINKAHLEFIESQNSESDKDKFGSALVLIQLSKVHYDVLSVAVQRHVSTTQKLVSEYNLPDLKLPDLEIMMMSAILAETDLKALKDNEIEAINQENEVLKEHLCSSIESGNEAIQKMSVLAQESTDLVSKDDKDQEQSTRTRYQELMTEVMAAKKQTQSSSGLTAALEASAALSSSKMTSIQARQQATIGTLKPAIEETITKAMEQTELEIYVFQNHVEQKQHESSLQTLKSEFKQDTCTAEQIQDMEKSTKLLNEEVKRFEEHVTELQTYRDTLDEMQTAIQQTPTEVPMTQLLDFLPGDERQLQECKSIQSELVTEFCAKQRSRMVDITTSPVQSLYVSI